MFYICLLNTSKTIQNSYRKHACKVLFTMVLPKFGPAPEEPADEPPPAEPLTILESKS